MKYELAKIRETNERISKELAKIKETLDELLDRNREMQKDLRGELDERGNDE